MKIDKTVEDVAGKWGQSLSGVIATDSAIASNNVPGSAVIIHVLNVLHLSFATIRRLSILSTFVGRQYHPFLRNLCYQM